MLSPDYEQHKTVEDLIYSSSENEHLDDIKADLISLTLSDSNSSIFHPNMKHPNNQNRFDTNYDNSSTGSHTRKDSSDSVIVILKSDSEKSPVGLPLKGEVPLLSRNAQGVKNGNLSSLKVTESSSSPNNNIETFLSPSSKSSQAFRENIKGLSNSELFLSDGQSLNREKFSFSLQDVSGLTEFPLKRKSCDFSSDTIHSQSMTTVSSGLKSKDSGLPRSISFLSLNSGGKNYDHVQSKVKEYIKQIKEAEEMRKSLKLNNKSGNTSHTGVGCFDNADNDSEASQEALTAVIKVLQYKLQDREEILSKLQENYDKLLKKYAEAENRIDKLRFKVIDPSLPLTSHDLEVGEVYEQYSYPIQDFISSGVSNPTLQCDKSSNASENFEGLLLEKRDSVWKPMESNIIKQKAAQKSCSSVLKCDSKKSLILNPLVKPYSSSVRLNKSINPLAHKSKTKTIEALIEGKNNSISPVSSLTDIKSSVKWSNCTNSDDRSTIASSYKKNPYKDTKKPVREEEYTCDLGSDVSKLELLELEHCNEMTVVPESTSEACDSCTDAEEILLSRKLLKQRESSKLHGTSFEKVVKWQESLPPLELIKPNSYGNLDCHSGGSKTSGKNLKKKFISPEGRDSGCPESDLYNFPVHSVKTVFPTMENSELTSDIIETSDVFPPTAINPCDKSLLNTHFAVLAYSVPTTRTGMHDSNELHRVTSKLNSRDFKIQDGLFASSSNVVQSRPLNNSPEASNVILPKPFSIESCECWKIEGELSSNKKKTEIPVEIHNRKLNRTFQTFDVPPLKLDSLLDIDDNVAVSDVNSLYSIDTTTESTDASKAHLYNTNCVKQISASQSTTEDVTYPSSRYMTSGTLTNEMLDELSEVNNKPHSSFSNIPSLNINQKDLNHSDKESKRKHSLLRFSNNYFTEKRNTRYKIDRNDSLQASITTSTSYRSIQPYIQSTEVKTASSQTLERKYASSQTTNENISAITEVAENSEPPSQHCIGIGHSDVTRRKPLASDLSSLLLDCLSIRNSCHNGCVHSKSAHQHAFCVKCREENTAKDSRNFIRLVPMQAKCRVEENKSSECDSRSTSQVCSNGNKSPLLDNIETEIRSIQCTGEERSNYTKSVNSENSEFNRVGISATSVSENQAPEEQKYNLMKCLDQMDQFAQQLKTRSEAILNILAVQLKPSS